MPGYIEVFIFLIPTFQLKLQKQPSRGVQRKRRSENMQQIYRRTPMAECNLNIEIALSHGCSPANLLHICTTPFSKNTASWLLLIHRLNFILTSFAFFKLYYLTTNCHKEC